MADKEQIIINGVVYYKQQDINKGLDEEHYITEFHLLATHYNLLLEDYARKAQECERKDKEIDELKQECEKLKEKLYQIDDIVKPINEQLPEDAVIRQIMLILNDCNSLKPSRYRKALEEIEEIAKGMRSVFIEEISITASQLNDRIYRESTARFRQILDIINKLKGLQ